MFDTVRQDVFYALRGFRKHPLFTCVIVLTLAIGIGATTAVFSVVDPLLFRDLPYAHGDRLVSWGLTAPMDENEFMFGRFYVQWKSLLVPFSSVTFVGAPGRVDLGGDQPLRVRWVAVQANLLSTLGVAVAAGRDFTAEDDRPGAPAVALLSYGLWQSRFGAKPSILEHTVLLDDQPTRVIGVLRKGFELPTLEQVDFLVPHQLDATAQLRSQTGAVLHMFGRLKPGVSIQQAREEIQPFLQHAEPLIPPQLRKEVHLGVRSLRDRQFYNLRLASWMLFAAVLALLLLSCANVANLLLARASSRRSELAIRAALGAGRLRLMRQGLTESLLLALCGAAGGCIFAWLLFQALGTLPPEGILRLKETTLSARVLLFTVATCLAAAIFFGIAPSVEQPGPEALAETRTAGSRRSLLRHLLLASQIAISIVLLAGASLFARSLRKLETQAIGLQPSHVVTASFEVDRHRYDTSAKLAVFYRQLESALEAIPGATEFALSDSAPPAGWMHERPFSNMSIAGRPPLPSEGGAVKFRCVTPSYFRLLQIPILLGRGFNEGDRTNSQNSIILSARLASRMFGQTNPLGQMIVLGPDGPPVMVIGVAGNVKNNGLANPDLPEYDLARKFADVPGADLGAHGVALFRTTLPPAVFEPSIRAEFARAAPIMPVAIETMKQRVDEQNERPRFLTVLISLFAFFGLTLAAIGLYGVAAFLVSQRTREIGIRMAVGATPRKIAVLVLKYAALWTGAGIAAGLLLSFALARLARGLLFEVSPHDPLSLAVATLILAATAFAASWWPSRRAARIDPNAALRHH